MDHAFQDVGHEGQVVHQMVDAVVHRMDAVEVVHQKVDVVAEVHQMEVLVHVVLCCLVSYLQEKFKPLLHDKNLKIQVSLLILLNEVL